MPRSRPCGPATTAQGSTSLWTPALDTGTLPSLGEVFTTSRPTLRHIPRRARNSWAKVLVRAVAAVVFYNNLNAWTELLMLPKCVLCAPPTQGRSNDTSVAAFALDRLSRWEAGERRSLWDDAPTYKNANPNTSDTARKTRAVTLARDGLDGKACAALTSTGLARENSANATKMRALHPTAPLPPRTPTSDLSLPPDIDTDLVLKCLRSFPADTAPGPTGMRVQHFLDAPPQATMAPF